MRKKRPKRHQLGSEPSPGLSYVLAQGGRTRRQRYIKEFGNIALPVALTILAQAAIYAYVTMRFGRNDWVNVALVAAVIATVPLFASAIFVILRRHESKLITSSVITLGLFCVAVTTISALRLPVSYQALFACMPVTTLIMAYTNVRFVRMLIAHVALADFPQAKEIAHDAGDIPILQTPEADLSRIEILLIDPIVHHNEKWAALLSKCYLSGIEIMPWTRYIELMRGRLDVSSFDISHLAYSPMQQLYAHLKRTLDIFSVVVSLPFTLPLAVSVATYIAARDGGPVIFVQLRRGYAGRLFRMYKFRTMYRGQSGGATAIGDRRIIPGCSIIRKLRLDELPQLYNILVGDMSLIGPRPESLDLDKFYERKISKYSLRQLVMPGITGWAQVNSGYTSNAEEAALKLSYDLYYIKHMSLDLDLQVLFRTVRTVIFAAGSR